MVFTERLVVSIEKCMKSELTQTLRISGLIVLGPLEEKEAMNGDDLTLKTAFGLVIKPLGFLEKPQMHYVRMQQHNLTN